MREIRGAVVAALLLVLSAASSGTAVAQDDGGARPSIESCEPVFRAEPIDGDEADKRRAGALIARLRDPEASYELSFRSRNTRHGAIYGDGEQFDVDVPALFLDNVGDALVDGSDHLAFIASRESRWSFAEMRRDGMRCTRFAPAEQLWGGKGVGGPGPVRLPDAMARTSAATSVTTPTGLDGHWYEVTMSADLGPGLMWDSTREVFEIIRDVDARLLIDVDDDGMPVMACLWQAWWQGEVIEEFVVGEDASLASAIRIEHMGSAPALPPEILARRTDASGRARHRGPGAARRGGGYPRRRLHGLARRRGCAAPAASGTKAVHGPGARNPPRAAVGACTRDPRAGG